MVHLGDITAIRGGEIAPTNCVIFGSPCQNLSTAGNRQGLAGAESGLFVEAVRVIKEMREATNGKYPTFAVWENVPGAFSSNKGEDFRVVLEELARIRQTDVSIPEPKRNKNGSLVWAKSGIIGGNGWSIAWRTLDAQYWGVPQRRRRIAVVVDFGGQRAGEILFERKGVSGDSEPSIPPWEGIARNPANRSAGYDRMVEGERDCLTPWDVQSRRIYGENGKWSAIYAGEGGGHGYVAQKSGCVTIPINTQIATRHISLGERTGMGWGEIGDAAYTLQAGHEHAVCYGITSTESNSMKSSNPYSGFYEAQTSRTLDLNGGNPSCNQGGIVVCQSMPFKPNNNQAAVVCAAFTAGQGAKAGGIGYAEEVSPTLRNEGGLSAMTTVVCRAHGQANAETLEECCPTLNCNHEAPIVFESHHKDARYTQLKNVSPTCLAYWGTGGNNMPMVAEKQCYSTSGLSKFSSEVAPLRASGGDNGGDSENLVVESRQKSLTAWDYESKRVYSANNVFPALVAHEKSGQNQQSILTHDSLRWIVRRLTPTECERLQGFPDDWTAIDSFTDKYGAEHKTSGWLDNKGKWHKAADSPRYKALGNSIALPQWWWITCKMAKYLPEHATMGSLFDGIGGFPLVWETRHGKGTALWASEIEAFPIAVTEKHFS